MRTILLVAMLLLTLGAIAHAEVIELEGMIKSIDQDARSIAITRRTAKGEKLLELEIAKNAGDISGFKEGDKISFAYNPDVDIISKMEKKAGEPDKRGTPIELIAKNSLDGWEFEEKVDEPTWAVSDNVLVCTGEGPNLQTKPKFTDFELSGEFLMPSRANSGIFFGPNKQFEFALLDTLWRNSRNEPARADEQCGAIYGKYPPVTNAYVGPNKWNRFVLLVQNNAVSATLNGTAVHKACVLEKGQQADATKSPAPLILQRHGTTIGVKFRNLVVVPLGGALESAEESKTKTNEDKTTQALKNLQGEWLMTAGEENGQPFDRGDVKRQNRRVVIKNNSLTMERVKGNIAKWTGSFEIDANAETFDWVGTNPQGAETKWVGIYSLDGDELRLCFRFNLDGQAERPTRFTSDDFVKPNATAVYTFKRDD